MTTPPITRRCPFCGATTEHLSVKNKRANGFMRKYVHCDFCGAHGPWCSYAVKSWVSIAVATASCVYEWNFPDGVASWANTRKSSQHHAKRAAFIAKWATRPTTTTTNNPNNHNHHQPKGKTTTP